MKTRNKALLLALCAVLLVTASVLGTMAYLTASVSVTNTFTVGKVAITLDEQDVDDSDNDQNVTERDMTNKYNLLPGHEYVKDPIVHVDPVSENCWVFVKIENGIAAYEAASKTIMEKGEAYATITEQVVANAWMMLDGVDNVYYQAYTKGQNDKELEVFQEFMISGEANTVAGWADIKPDTTTVSVTAYAVQKDTFDTAKDAWDAANFGA